jgi:5'-nucleotidase
MRILITNDDGINAPGLAVLEGIAAELAGIDGEVWIVAPAFEQSGVSHAVSYTHPMMITELGPRRFAAEGSPADCVLAALFDVMDERPDLVLCGVNRGNNSGENVLYSGTIGGAMEAALQGLPAIALSQFMGEGNRSLEDPFESAKQHGVDTIAKLLSQGLWDTEDYRLFYSINFPPVSAAETKAPVVAPQGFRRGTSFSVEPHLSPSGKRFLWIKGGKQDVSTAPGSDVERNLAGHITITPMSCDLTLHAALEPLTEALK